MSLRNPVAMRGRIEKCWLFSYRTAPEEARKHLPADFQPLTYGGFAFWNLLVCRVGKMRPRGFPAALGISYWHVAYRIPVRYQSPQGELEGLYFVRSDCSSGLVARAGNLLTDFNFHQAGIELWVGNSRRIEIVSPEAAATIQLGDEPPKGLEAGSPFPDLATADSFLKYKPAALAVLPDKSVQILRIGRDEAAWRNRLIQVRTAVWAFLKDKKATLEICQEVEPIEYLWNRGERVGP